MGGVGKTTLAQVVYNHPRVAEHFQIRAWCTVSQVYRMRELFLEILRDVMAVSNRIYDMDEDRLAGVLYKCLKQKKYLIVLDDIWDSAALDALRRSFPDDNSGSRIMLTARKRNVASQADLTCIFPLSHRESWNLLRRKTFGDTYLPPELGSIGEELVDYCHGVPLAIFIMAGVLEKNKWNLSYCLELLQKLFSDRVRGRNVFLSLLKVAYGSLPDHLKPCFLYLGEFPENQEIPARKLLRLWITNGLIQETESKAPEDVAEEYLLEIISRNLVIISRRTHNGRVRGCRVHDVVSRSMKRGELLLS
nr:putative late blight resistance protein homolog R1A-10 [Coffea arabica]XP_027098222.1 putative late blight resistance protein homolog R1A-10 [Coffea arabica]XP_027100113.1 putative late blight resistance protein homolog R1A-10 [Coffea arabica]XP_027100114.1 putative late blight resistance protein homolog R1A-10 [Coffea arabica]